MAQATPHTELAKLIVLPAAQLQAVGVSTCKDLAIHAFSKPCGAPRPHPPFCSGRPAAAALSKHSRAVPRALFVARQRLTQRDRSALAG